MSPNYIAREKYVSGLDNLDIRKCCLDNKVWINSASGTNIWPQKQMILQYFSQIKNNVLKTVAYSVQNTVGGE